MFWMLKKVYSCFLFIVFNFLFVVLFVEIKLSAAPVMVAEAKADLPVAEEK